MRKFIALAALMLAALLAFSADAQMLTTGRSNQPVQLKFRTTSATAVCINTLASQTDSATAKRVTGATVKDTTAWISTQCFLPPTGVSTLVDSSTVFRVIWSRYFPSSLGFTDAAPTLTVQAAYNLALDANCANVAQFSLCPNITMVAAGTGIYQSDISWVRAMAPTSLLSGGTILPPFVRFIFSAAYNGEFEAWLHAPSSCGGGNVN